MSTSPFFDSQYPEYAALLGGGGLNISSLSGHEQVRVYVYIGARIAFDSGEMGIDSLSRYEQVLSYRVDGRYPRVYFVYTRWRNGYPIRTTTRLSVASRAVSSSIKQLTVSGRTIPYQALVRKARASTAGVSQRTRSQVVRSSSPLRPNPEIVQIPTRRVTENQGSGGVPTITSGLRNLLTREWTGVRTPNFKRLKPRQYPVNNHTVRMVVIDQDGPNVEWNSNATFGTWNYVVDSYSNRYAVPGDPVHSERGYNKALKRLISAANSDIDANIAQDFAQIGQTTKLVASTATKIARSVLALKQLKFTQAANHLFAGRKPLYRGKGPSAGASLASNWLELQYGWKPLLQDIHGAFNALSTLNEDESFVHRVVASATDFAESVENLGLGATLPSSAGSHMRLTRVRSTTRFTIRYRIESPLKAFLAQTGFTNPINLAWEILPFSFVVDWFLPIGPYLETLSSWDGLTFSDGSQTRFTRQLVASVINYQGISLLNPTLLQHGHGAYQRSTVIMDRTRLFTFPAAYFPSIKNGLASVDHALNAVALLRSAFK